MAGWLLAGLFVRLSNGWMIAWPNGSMDEEWMAGGCA
jgi:hypothetical protein